ncbi:transposase [Streptomyces sp. NBC_01186]|uniref:IS701 family transposase n=1 Tax=Streptomyces sp. NBC_01186 TaxID=2903765 RepID=UPI002E0D8AA8|nr:transposase [Streptomyces sp. NBC_01186]
MVTHPVLPGTDDHLARFLDEVFSALPRCDQRRWAGAYLHGLLTVRGRKSLRNLAGSVSASSTASQCLQQFISASTWEWAPLRLAVARYAQKSAAVEAWTVATAAIPKRGEQSVGVRRRFVPELGRTLNCQSAVGLFLATEAGSVPVDWRLRLDGPWALDAGRRRRARLPEHARPQPVWADVLEMTAQLSAQLLPAPVVADLRVVAASEQLMAGLADQELDFLVEISPDQEVLPRPGRHTSPRTALPRATGAATLARRTRDGIRPPGQAAHLPRSVPGTYGEQLVPCPVLVTLPRVPAALRMWAQWQPGRVRPARVWLTNLTHARPQTVARLIRHAGDRAAVAALEEDFGLLDFEGRSYPGWHHHMTMVSAACAYRSLQGRSALAATA